MDAPIQLYEESTITNGYVKVDTYGTFYKNLGTLGEFFVKVNVSYFGNVSNRLEDIIGISNSDNVQIKSEYINGSQRPKFEFNLTYMEDYYCRDFTTYPEKVSEYTSNHSLKYDGKDLTQYKYYIDKGIIVKYDLPSDYHNTSSSAQIKQEKNIEYYNFKATIAADFVVKQTGLNACTFAGLNIIQNEGGEIDFSKISISTTIL